MQTLDALQQGGVPFAFRMKVFGAGPNPIDYLNVDAFMLDNLLGDDTFEMDQFFFAYEDHRSI